MPAGRPADPQRRERVLAAATDYVLEHGLDDLSLRPLATALGTSPRMLLYDFDSKSELVRALVESVRARLARMAAAAYTDRSSSRAVVEALWGWLIDPSHAGYVRLFAQLQVVAVNHPEYRRQVGGPVPRKELQAATQASRAEIVLIDSTLHALAIRRLGESEPEVVDAAFEAFLTTVRT